MVIFVAENTLEGGVLGLFSTEKLAEDFLRESGIQGLAYQYTVDKLAGSKMTPHYRWAIDTETGKDIQSECCQTEGINAPADYTGESYSYPDPWYNPGRKTSAAHSTLSLEDARERARRQREKDLKTDEPDN